MLASLALCGGATAALVATNARAQTNVRKPVMVALVAPGTMLAQNNSQPGARELRDMRMPTPAEMTAHMKQMCEDRYAREVGEMAYLETRLKLTQAEQPLFARWKEVKLDIAKHRSADCGQRASQPDRQEFGLVERMGQEEDMLKKRLADLEAERPALTALYNALTPQQREDLSPRHERMLAGGMMDRGRFGRPSMGMGDHPLPPPPQ